MEKKSYQQLKIEDQRLIVLQVMHEDRDYTVNNKIIGLALDQLGHGEPANKVLALLGWLADAEALTLHKINNQISVATLTNRGKEYALGKAQIDGIARPEPK